MLFETRKKNSNINNLTLGDFGVLSLFVLSDLVESVLLALETTAVCTPLLRYVNLRTVELVIPSILVSTTSLK